MIITLFYASLLLLLYIVLAARVAVYRGKSKISLGTGADRELEVRMRVQANFNEYVPFLLILMGFLESLQASRYGLHGLGIVLVVARLLHAWGLSRGGEVNALRGIGAGLTILVGLVAAVWGLCLTIPAL